MSCLSGTSKALHVLEEAVYRGLKNYQYTQTDFLASVRGLPKLLLAGKINVILM